MFEEQLQSLSDETAAVEAKMQEVKAETASAQSFCDSINQELDEYRRKLNELKDRERECTSASNSLMKYGMNPVYDFSIPTTMTAIFYLELVHNNKLAIHLCLYTKRDWEAQNFNNVLIDSGDYRNWSCDFLTTLEPGDYSLVASSYPSVMNIGFLH